MPARPSSPCTHQPCAALVPGGGACPVHGRARYRGSSTKQGYGVEHRRLRDVLFTIQFNCQRCGAPGTASDHADHKRSRRQGGADVLANLQRLCRSCHSSKTADEDGGFGNKVRAGWHTVRTGA